MNLIIVNYFQKVHIQLTSYTLRNMLFRKMSENIKFFENHCMIGVLLFYGLTHKPQTFRLLS